MAFFLKKLSKTGILLKILQAFYFSPSLNSVLIKQISHNRAYNTTKYMGEIGNIVPDHNTVIHLLSYKDDSYQYKGKWYFSVLEACK